MNTNLPRLVADFDSENGGSGLLIIGQRPRFNASDVHTAFGNTPGSGRKLDANAPEPGDLWTDTAETRSFLQLQYTNAWPRVRRSRAIPAARKASIC